MSFDNYIAHAHHIDDSNKYEVQTIKDHEMGVATLAENFAAAFGMGDWGYLSGIYHDKGKYRKNFQSYIRQTCGITSNDIWNGEDKQHAYIGAKLVKADFPEAGSLLSSIIVGHHSGLENQPDYLERMKKEIPNIPAFPRPEIRLCIKDEILQGCDGGRQYHHLVRMLYSCLVDADYLDTEAFMNTEDSNARKGCAEITVLTELLDKYLSRLNESAKTSSLNKLRYKIQKQCRQKGSDRPGFYSLTVPTGGGKTLSSLLWAMTHCLKWGKRRIIIAIPYTSIITQTASILKEIFGEENVLEHHSEFNPESIKDPAIRRKMKLASENWDYPIVVTTNVQIFESIFDNRPSKCRKLHNIAESVLILDEVQTLPLTHLQPVIDALVAYNNMFGVSVLFTTASLPALEGKIEWSANGRLRGIPVIKEIIPEGWNLHKQLKRTEIIFDREITDISHLTERIAKEQKVLCIANTRKLAKEIYDQLPEDAQKIHLSRLMCSAHLKAALAQIKKELQHSDRPLVVVSTQLIEAGVDIDFPAVYRQMSGLDSILQAAGRCNREGMNDSGRVIIFNLGEIRRGEIGRRCDSTESIGTEIDIFSPSAMINYFKQLYTRTPNFDKSGIAEKLYNFDDWQYREAAESFKMIDTVDTRTVIVNYGEAPGLIEAIKYKGPQYPIMKKLSQYTVTIYRQDFQRLCESGSVIEVLEGIYYVWDKKMYNPKLGLTFENHWMNEILTY